MKREDQIKSLKKKLIQRRAELSQLLEGELMQLHNSDDAVGGDLVDLTVEVDCATVNSTLAEGESDELSAIDAALVRVKEGTYGRCSECGKNIPIDRLRNVPSADMCVPCQEAKDLLQNSIHLSNNSKVVSPAPRASTSRS